MFFHFGFIPKKMTKTGLLPKLNAQIVLNAQIRTVELNRFKSKGKNMTGKQTAL